MTAPGLPIGEVAERSGLATSAIRYYEERGLIRPSAGNQDVAASPRRPPAA